MEFILFTLPERRETSYNFRSTSFGANEPDFIIFLSLKYSFISSILLFFNFVVSLFIFLIVFRSFNNIPTVFFSLSLPTLCLIVRVIRNLRGILSTFLFINIVFLFLVSTISSILLPKSIFVS